MACDDCISPKFCHSKHKCQEHNTVIGESTMMADMDGHELFLGDVVRALVEKPFQLMHGSWAEYEIGKGAGGYVLLYVRSETGCQLPFGYTATFMNQFEADDMDFKQLIWSKTPVPHPALRRVDSNLSPAERRELFIKETNKRLEARR